jgi:hypothetical protein
MKLIRHRFLKPCFVFLVLFTFSMLVFGCWEDGETKVQNERLESRKLKEKDGLNAKEVDAVVINTSGSKSSQTFQVKDEIHLDEWMQLTKYIKLSLVEMEKENK